MSYLNSIEISRVEMSPAEERSYTTGTSKSALYILVAFKIIELSLLICCIGLVDEPAMNSSIRTFITPRVVALCYVTFGSFLIYTAIYLIMALFGELSSWRTSALWSIVAFILFVAATALLFRDWSSTKNLNYWHPNMHRLDLVLATASIALVTSLVYILDILATIRYGFTGALD